MYAHMLVRTRKHTYKHAHTHTHAHTQARTHTRRHAHTHTHTHTHTHACAHTRRHARTHACMHSLLELTCIPCLALNGSHVLAQLPQLLLHRSELDLKLLNQGVCFKVVDVGHLKFNKITPVGPCHVLNDARGRLRGREKPLESSSSTLHCNFKEATDSLL